MIEKKTIPKLLENQVSLNGQGSAIGWIDQKKIKSINFLQYHEKIMALSLAYLKYQNGESLSIALLAETSKEWHFLDISAISIGAIVVPIYPSALASEVEHILNETESQVLMLDSNTQLEKFFEIENIPKSIKFIITLFKPSKGHLEKGLEAGIQLLTYDIFLKTGLAEFKLNPELFNIRSNLVKEKNIATIIYTSGTTGPPKGAIISHLAFTQMLLNLHSFFSSSINSSDKSLIALPLSHSLGRCNSFLHISFGLFSIFGNGLPLLEEDCALVKPTLVLGVPSYFEKIYSRIKSKIKKNSNIEQRAYSWAFNASENYFNKIDNDLSPSSLEIIKRNIAYKSFYQYYYNLFGGKLKFFICGGAPLSSEVSIFLRHCNLNVLEGYGLTETIGPCAVNPTRRPIPHTVGLPIGDVKIKLSAKNEILIQSESLFSSFLNSNQNIFDEDGWFHTGDIGLIGEEGYLQIIDRLSDIIMTSDGRAISPQKIEAIMTEQDHIEQFVAIGEGRQHITGIVSLDKAKLADALKKCGLDQSDSLESMAKNEQLYELIRLDIEKSNKKLRPCEQIKKFIISTRKISLHSGLVTPMAKTKRKSILMEFSKEIEDMYEELQALT